ncbi:hypothetical protein NEUTE1DRAFT_48295 [Neurospora tetrasperma FGSC 2508]|uniref:Uncharacterized protein n=1 Tax=Neurospora tetrasperma (strain FGSC 2508 / ATCC MYA-4615 / P0657) TaxID=510951 RepID=F8MUH6_NEUT8|nr:uncharacterized protein NEUTE1DRAFT_48295 [Neurospora tetrasperma FGSC 2508]EGO55658.1 hypothetical protein NEUTE1DRAFT_48295 [Neurospora tetrasperma FGSC 2508]EGZ69094.1 hypothetical protein NEUTE2DRAFT_70977 [Neurospora tetrasperma FGSC 2509]
MSANQPVFTISITPNNIASSYHVTMTETATGSVIITMTPVIQPSNSPPTTNQPYISPPTTPPPSGAGAGTEDSDNHTSEAE